MSEDIIKFCPTQLKKKSHYRLIIGNNHDSLRSTTHLKIDTSCVLEYNCISTVHVLCANTNMHC